MWIACENNSLAQKRILLVVRYEWSRAKTGRDKSAIDNDDDDGYDVNDNDDEMKMIMTLVNLPNS